MQKVYIQHSCVQCLLNIYDNINHKRFFLICKAAMLLFELPCIYSCHTKGLSHIIMTQCHRANYFIVDDDDAFGSAESLMDGQVWLQHLSFSLPLYCSETVNLK